MTHRFEVDYKQRLEQSRTASNAVRLPRLGYKLYRIYVIEEPKKESSHTMTVSKSRRAKDASRRAFCQQVLLALINELETEIEPAYEVKWLKPKQTTLLRMHGHRVEPAQPGDRVGHVGPVDKPVRLGP